MRLPRFGQTAVAVVLALAAPLAWAASLITAEDLLKIRQLGDIAISPDGREVVYTVKSIEAKPDAKGDYVYRTHLWLARLDGSAAPRALTYGAAGGSSPEWSPDGQRLAFVRVVDDKPQIFILPLQSGGEAWALTKLPQGATRPQWSPDGRRIAFTVDLSYSDVRKLEPDTPPPWPDERPGRAANDTALWPKEDKAKSEAKARSSGETSALPPARPDGSRAEQREWLAKHEARADPRVLTRLDFLGESGLEPELSFSQLYVVDVREGAKPQRITAGYADAAEPVWTRDGRALIFASARRADLHPDREPTSDLFVADVATHETRRLIAIDTHRLRAPCVSPDGTQLAFLAQSVSDPSYGQWVVGVATIDGSGARLISEKIDRSAGTPKWSPDGRAVYFLAPSNGGFPLFRVTVATGAVERLTDFEHGIRDYDVRAERIAAVLTSAANPYEVVVGGLDAASLTAVTTHNQSWLADRILSRPERHQLTHDGREIDYWLIKPAATEAGRHYPLLLEIHGGPSAMWGPGEDTTWHEFQFFAARGYGVVFANPRGSGGYGYAFQKANYRDWGRGPSSDVLAAADAATREPWVDADRQVVTGGSYGGYLTAWIVSHDQRFKAAVAVRGVYDLTTFFGEGNAWRLVPEHFGGYPWQPDVRAVLEANSPFTFVAQITTPLLIKHGDADRRTGFVQSEMLYHALKVLNRPVEYARYPGGTHELSRSGEPRQRLDRLVRFDEFFRRFIGEN